jgi:hypothetical protein
VHDVTESNIFIDKQSSEYSFLIYFDLVQKIFIVIVIICFQANNEIYYQSVLTKAINHLSQMQFDLLKLSLSIRTYSPAIEMSRKVIYDYSEIIFKNSIFNKFA